MQLVLTNTSSQTCTLQGYAGVSYVAFAGTQVGAPAQRVSGPEPLVSLAPGASATATLAMVDAGNFGSSCGLTPTRGLRVYPPNQTAALFVSQAGQGCKDASFITLYIHPFQPA